ncbi:MAG: hypothetical protein E6G76_05785 [Alphaproteobacteria bacterium]|nr:MAG: hypothetical protein E6G76_05785 [Alphaproteobacteria bacterium]
MMVCLAIIGGAGVGGLAAGFNVRAGLSPQPSTTVVASIAKMAPSETVGLRFPADWAEPSSEPVCSGVRLSRRLMLASCDSLSTAFERCTGREATAGLASAAAVGCAGIVGRTSASLMPKPKPKPRSNAVLNESQLASIKRRLNLTPEQERYWPAIEAELRKMEYTKSSGGSRTASIDMSKVNVDGLKSAGFPLVMSFSDDQRRELKSLTHLLGLESVMAGL